MNPEASPSLSETFFQEVLTAYNKFSLANDELSIRFSEDISAVINKLFEMLKRIDEESENSASLLEGTRFIAGYLKQYERGLEPYLAAEEEEQQEHQ